MTGRKGIMDVFIALCRIYSALLPNTVVEKLMVHSRLYLHICIFALVAARELE
jgi:hypothetical protein